MFLDSKDTDENEDKILGTPLMEKYGTKYDSKILSIAIDNHSSNLSNILFQQTSKLIAHMSHPGHHTSKISTNGQSNPILFLNQKFSGNFHKLNAPTDHMVYFDSLVNPNSEQIWC